MQNVEQWMSAIPPGLPGTMATPGLPDLDFRLAQEQVKNNQFVGLLNAFRSSGGLARVQEVANRFRSQGPRDVSPLPGWIAKREVISLEWQSRIWLPLFQFNPGAMTLRSGLSAVLAELVHVHDDWGVATWFTQANACLAGGAPADHLATSASQVRIAALAERSAAPV